MKKEKNKRDYLPRLRRLLKDLEDAIIERKSNDEGKSISEIKKTLSEIERSKFLDD